MSPYLTTKTYMCTGNIFFVHGVFIFVCLCGVFVLLELVLSLEKILFLPCSPSKFPFNTYRLFSYLQFNQNQLILFLFLGRRVFISVSTWSRLRPVNKLQPKGGWAKCTNFKLDAREWSERAHAEDELRYDINNCVLSKQSLDSWYFILMFSRLPVMSKYHHIF